MRKEQPSSHSPVAGPAPCESSVERKKSVGTQHAKRKTGSALGVSGRESSPRTHPLHLARLKRHFLRMPPKSCPHSLRYRSPTSPWHSSQLQLLCCCERPFDQAPTDKRPHSAISPAPGSCLAQVGAC